MESTDARTEMEEHLGLVPSFMEMLAEPAFDHTWGIFRDLELGETELPGREKGLIGTAVAAALQCPYCTHFHKEEAKLNGATEAEIEEAVNLAASTRYFSTILHGSEMDLEDFVSETAEIVDHVERQAAQGD